MYFVNTYFHTLTLMECNYILPCNSVNSITITIKIHAQNVINIPVIDSLIGIQLKNYLLFIYRANISLKFQI